MQENTIISYTKNILQNIPKGWLTTTTHRLDIYNESLAKVEFLEKFETLFNNNDSSLTSLNNLPTAYDYIRLGHPLSCVLEWTIAKLNNLTPQAVISFDSQTIPVLAILRKNLLNNTQTQIVYTNNFPDFFNLETVKEVYGYQFETIKTDDVKSLPKFNGSRIFITQQSEIDAIDLQSEVDFYINTYHNLGSILIINNNNDSYISDIQHVRRRETVAMTPLNCFSLLENIVDNTVITQKTISNNNKESVLKSIQNITGISTKPLVASSGLSIQYAILMGLIDDALENHPQKSIKIIVPPNCYGGTNDQARRVAACIKNVEIVDFPVDGDNDMVKSIDTILQEVATQDAIPYIIAEIPTNPRVEVPDLIKLREVLSKDRITSTGNTAIKPVFILDQTFCPNIQFLSDIDMSFNVKTISFASGSKFPSGGKCTAGYCIGNNDAISLIGKIEKHLLLCDNEATDFQYEILATQMPSMNQRIEDAYKNTRDFVTFITNILPEAKINFVSEELAKKGFTPSVFSLDLPTKGDSSEEKENYKRALNHKLINLMINEIPSESKYCVSYGQLKGCYWTIPATSTQGTTKESDKDYIARVSLSPDMNLELHKKVFTDFVKSI